MWNMCRYNIPSSPEKHQLPIKLKQCIWILGWTKSNKKQLVEDDLQYKLSNTTALISWKLNRKETMNKCQYTQFQNGNNNRAPFNYMAALCASPMMCSMLSHWISLEYIYEKGKMKLKGFAVAIIKEQIKCILCLHAGGAIDTVLVSFVREQLPLTLTHFFEST